MANQTSATYSSTNTVFTFDVEGKVTLKATFLSPVYPNDLVKQSLQHSYIDVTAVSADGASHSVQVYFDSSGELASGADASQNITWDHGTNGGVEYHTFQLSNQRQFVEISDQPAWGQWFVSTADTDGVSSQSECSRMQGMSSNVVSRLRGQLVKIPPCVASL